MRIGMVLVGLVVLSGCGDDGDPAGSPAADPTTVSCVAGGGGDAEVAITGYTFQPHDTVVDAGRSVTFTNQDPTQHSVWSAVRVDGDPAFESVGADPSARRPELLDEDGASTCTFGAPGTYEYLCGVHNNMTGTITVR